MNKKTRLILCLDGGGMKGYFSALFMAQLCTEMGINGNEIWKYFDIIAGTSIGAIMAGGYAAGKSPQDMQQFFTTYGSQIFTSSFGTPMPATQKKLFFGSPIGSVNFPKNGESFYGDNSSLTMWGDLPNSVLVNQLKATFGDTKLFQLKTNVMFNTIERRVIDPTKSASFYYRPVTLSNMKFPGLEGADYLTWESVLASGSAPMYFPPAKITGAPSASRFLDGGLPANNPVIQALTYGSILYPDAASFVVVSVGCGLGTVGFFEPPINQLNALKLLDNLGDNIEYTTQMIDAAGTGAQEISAQLMQTLASYNTRINNANLFHYRFNNVYDKSVNTELDNSSPAFFSELNKACTEQLKKDTLKRSIIIDKMNL